MRYADCLLQNHSQLFVIVGMHDSVDAAVDEVDVMEAQVAGHVVGGIQDRAVSCDNQKESIKRL